jgi:dienelactone hydrolase
MSSRASLPVLLLVALARAPAGAAQLPDELSVLDGWMLHSDVENSLYRHVADLAFRQLDRREEQVGRIVSAQQWLARRADVRRTLGELVGRFPERTPLNARVTGTLQGDGFHVEKLLFESMPGYWVTAAVFVPESIAERRPAIVYASGHSVDGFRSATYQTAILNLARQGFIVLAFDPVGQGERRQYDDPETGMTRVGGPTREHSYPGAQIFLTGDSPALYFIWDGMRAIDYLLTRADVDAGRIGVTGRSGGGTQAAYIAAFDERVLAAAPENYLTSFRRLLESRGPQDAEQNLFNGIERGIDHADLILAHAPKPYLLIATTRDMFSIQGVRETAHEARRAYGALGEPGRFRVVEDDAEHASTPRNREAMYAFFREALEWPGDPTELAVTPYAPDELWVTETGQVATSLGGEDLFSLNRARVERLVERLHSVRRSDGHLDAVRSAARELSGYEAPGPIRSPVFYGRYRRDGYALEQYTVAGEGDYPIPMILALPRGEGPHPAILYLHPDGKAADAGVGGPVESLVRRGYVVVAPDLLGIGELGPGAFRGDAFDFGLGIGAYNVWWGANQVGRSLVGIRAGDAVRVLRFLRGRDDVRTDAIGAVGVGTMGPVLLHAAAFDDSVSAIALVGAPASYAELALNRYYRPELVHAAVPGALRGYDLPDLAGTLAPRPLLIADAVDHMGVPMPVNGTRETYAVTTRAFEAQSGAARPEIVTTGGVPDVAELLATWLGNALVR